MTWRRIALFIVGVQAIAWLAGIVASNVDPSHPGGASVGLSIAVLGPVCMAILLRTVGKEGWQNAGLRLGFKNNRAWYLFSAIYPALTIGIVISLSLIFDTAKLNSDLSSSIGSVAQMMGILIIPMLLFSVCEEFGWRGYLEPNLHRISSLAVVNHVIVGVVWGFWHFPILVLGGSSQADGLQLTMVLVGCVALGILYGQMRLRSNTVWPCVILHALSNTFMVAFATSDILIVSPEFNDIVSFSTTSLAVTGLWIVTSIAIAIRFSGKQLLMDQRTE